MRVKNGDQGRRSIRAGMRLRKLPREVADAVVMADRYPRDRTRNLV